MAKQNGPDWHLLAKLAQARQQKRIADEQRKQTEILRAEKEAKQAERAELKREREKAALERQREKESRERARAEKQAKKERASQLRDEQSAIAKVAKRLAQLAKDSRLQQAVRELQLHRTNCAELSIAQLADGQANSTEVYTDRLREVRSAISQVELAAAELNECDLVTVPEPIVQQLKDLYSWLTSSADDLPRQLVDVSRQLCDLWTKADSLASSVTAAVCRHEACESGERVADSSVAPWREQAIRLAQCLRDAEVLTIRIGEVTQQSGKAFNEAVQVGNTKALTWSHLLRRAGEREKEIVRDYWMPESGDGPVSRCIEKATRWLDELQKCRQQSDREPDGLSVLESIAHMRSEVSRDIHAVDSSQSESGADSSDLALGLQGLHEQLTCVAAVVSRQITLPTVLSMVRQASQQLHEVRQYTADALQSLRPGGKASQMWSPRSLSQSVVYWSWYAVVSRDYGFGLAGMRLVARDTALVPAVAAGKLLSDILVDESVQERDAGGSPAQISSDEASSITNIIADSAASWAHPFAWADAASIYSLARASGVLAEWMRIGEAICGKAWIGLQEARRSGGSDVAHDEIPECLLRLSCVSHLACSGVEDAAEYRCAFVGGEGAKRDDIMVEEALRELLLVLDAAIKERSLLVDHLSRLEFSEAKSKRVVCGLAGIFGGMFGLQRLLLGDWIGAGIRCLLSTLCLAGWIVGVIEGVIYLSLSDDDFMDRYQIKSRKWF